MIEMRGRTPVEALRPYVADLIGYAYRGEPPALHRGLPTQFLTLVISLDEPLGVALPGHPVDKFRTLVSGLHSTAVRVGESPNRAGVQVALTPLGARTLLGLPPGELASTTVDLDRVLGPGAARLPERLAELPAWEDRFAALEGFLVRAAERRPAGVAADPVPELDWSWRRLRESSGMVGVQEIAAEVGWSRRHLTDRFQREYGLPPKVAARVLRFERAVAVIRRDPRTRLADLAAGTGYADQAHLTREWQSIAGCTPRQWIAEELPFVQDAPEFAHDAGAHD
jgi:AraC-like DNA-binding protein